IITPKYKSFIVAEYFFNYHMLDNDFTIDLSTNTCKYSTTNNNEKWQVTLVDTGVDTLKGGRIKRAEQYLGDDINMLTYGDGVADVNIEELVAFHRSHGKTVTLTGVRPPSRFGELLIKDGQLLSFEEKPQVSSGMINGGFMVFNRSLLSMLTTDKNCDFEFCVLENLAKQGEVMVYQHQGFWECVDTERDLNHLNKLWNENKANWKLW
ncbi:MAG: sugar phosphate nucleotidyltransferase, partial [Acidobacteria bacterium]|nr:sugar phosphate nucleotidyltransferase [Acidobacteriota bacterium]